MKKRLLGRTSLLISEIGFGAWAIGGTSYGPTDDRASRRALSFAFEQGVNFFDTADTYGHGHSEKLIGETFRKSSIRKQVILASKVGWDFYHGASKKNFDAAYIRFACGESLKRLKTDYLDLYQLHNPSYELIKEGNVFKVLTDLHKEGKIRFWGVSIHTVEEGTSAIQNGGADTIQAVYNLIDQKIREKLMPNCKAHDMGLIVREPLACGLLTGKYSLESRFLKTDHRNRWTQEKLKDDFKRIERVNRILEPKKISLKQAAIEFVLLSDSVSCVIPGIKTEEQLQDHLNALKHPKLEMPEAERLKALVQDDELFQIGAYRN